PGIRPRRVFGKLSGLTAMPGGRRCVAQPLMSLRRQDMGGFLCTAGGQRGLEMGQDRPQISSLQGPAGGAPVGPPISGILRKQSAEVVFGLLQTALPEQQLSQAQPRSVRIVATLRSGLFQFRQGGYGIALRQFESLVIRPTGILGIELFGPNETRTSLPG